MRKKLLVKSILSLARFSRVAEGFGDRLWHLGQGLVNYLKVLNPLRIFRRVKAHFAGSNQDEARHPVSFAAESFLWMTSTDKKGNKRRLSANEEQALGKILASRIQTIAREQLLYQKFPREASLFLYLWAHYGSREETDHYLTSSFQSKPENAIGLLKCFLTTPGRPWPGPARKTGFSRTLYDSVAKVVDPNIVYEALAKLYGPELDRPEGEEAGYSPDKVIASQFARIHQLVKRKSQKADRATRADKAVKIGTNAS